MLAKVLVMQFISVLGSIIYKDQLCAVSGHQIHGTLLQLQDVLQFQQERGQNIVLTLDL